MNEVYFQIAVLLYTSLAFDVAVLNTIFYYYFIGRVNQLLQISILFKFTKFIIDDHHLTVGLIINTVGFVGQS